MQFGMRQFLLFLFICMIVGNNAIDPKINAALYQRNMESSKIRIPTLVLSLQQDLLVRQALTFDNASSICEFELQTLIAAASRRELWAIKVFDAWGKPLPSGLLTGNLFLLGNYDECVDLLYQNDNRSFVSQPIDTQYCALHSKPTQPVDIRTGFILGLCVPASCNRRSIISLLQNEFNITEFTENNLRCSNDRHNEDNENWSGTIAFIIILSALIMFVLVGTIIDMWLGDNVSNEQPRQLVIHKIDSESSHELAVSHATSDAIQQPSSILKRKQSYLLFVAEFSAIRTLRRVFTIKKRQGENIFNCLDGIRVLSLCWVILGHSVSSGIYYTSNFTDMQAAQRNIIIHLLVSGAFAVDTFFILSGFLTAILFVRQVEKEGFSIRLMILYYIHRYLRLTPSFILVMFVSIYLTPYFGRGPLYPIQQGFEPEKCREGNWWSAFLYVGNFLKSDDICLGITWYLYNDMQFHWIAPIALVPYVKQRKWIGVVCTLVFVCVSIFSTLGILLYYPNLVKPGTDPNTNRTEPIFFDIVYMAPWCRIGAYAIGMLTAFIIIHTGRNFRFRPLFRILGHTLAIFLGFVAIYWKYLDTVSTSGLSYSVLLVYQILSRTLWSISIGWLIFICSTNQGGLVNRLLSSPRWTPMVNLNYATYLIHITIIFITVFNQSNPLFYQSMTCLVTFVAHLVLSYLAAILVVVFFESPFFILEKKILKH